MQDELIPALDEEIGSPKLFTGRKNELSFFLDWCENAKMKQAGSTALLARRKKGKTALVQRLYNILYTKNDPMLIPFYFRIEEGDISWLTFSSMFYRSFVGQYLAFKTRDIRIIKKSLDFDGLLDLSAETDKVLHEDILLMQKTVQKMQAEDAWNLARTAGPRIAGQKNVRIIQILDEFQFLNQHIYLDATFTKKVELASFYHGTAESKVSPQLVTGSYIGWLTTIIRKMVSRYDEYYLKSFPEDEALDTVYNYSTLYRQPVTDETAPFIAKICDHDPYYIARVIRSRFEHKDLTSENSILETLEYETTSPGGLIAKMWLEYISEAFEQVNDRNAKAIVLYLAKYGSIERTREEIKADLNLQLSDNELEERLHKLVKADILAQGKSNFDYKGLGDKIFEIVFRRIYEKEINRISNDKIEADIRKQLKSLKSEISYQKGLSGEFRVINLLMFTLYRGCKLEDIVKQALPGFTFGPFVVMEKKTFHLDPKTRVEVDIFCESDTTDGIDFIVEVKDWKTKITMQAVENFITQKQKLEEHLAKKTGFIFYSENGVPEEMEKLLLANGIMTSCRKLLGATKG